RRYRVSLAPHLAVGAGGGHPDRPVAGSAYVAGAAGLHSFEGALTNLARSFLGGEDSTSLKIAGSVKMIVPHDVVAGVKDVLQSLRLEVALLLGNPFLEPVVRLDFEHHRSSLSPPRAGRPVCSPT